MGKNRVCYSKVTLCILEVNWVHFVRHGGRTYLFLFDNGFEIAYWKVLPHVSDKIHKNSVSLRNIPTYLRQRIMRLNLRSIRVVFHAQTFNKGLGNINPVALGICCNMSVEVAHCSIAFSQQSSWFQLIDLPKQTEVKVCHLLAQGSWSCDLSMSAWDHGIVCMVLC